MEICNIRKTSQKKDSTNGSKGYAVMYRHNTINIAVYMTCNGVTFRTQYSRV